jgi:hypothetical protein
MNASQLAQAAFEASVANADNAQELATKAADAYVDSIIAAYRAGTWWGDR